LVRLALVAGLQARRARQRGEARDIYRSVAGLVGYPRIAHASARDDRATSEHLRFA
jgi:hypothetical protein